MKTAPDLSQKLKAILAFELTRGNAVVRVDRPAGSTCPLAVILLRRLDFRGYKAKHHLPDNVEIWESRDPHYPFEAGYFCNETRHSITGPLK